MTQVSRQSLATLAKLNAHPSFVAIKGTHSDGHTYLEDVWENGCDYAIVETINPELELTQIKVSDSRLAFARLQALVHGNPAESLKLIGVTGTNGKTSISYIINHLLKEQGIKTGLIGTTGIEIDKKRIEATHTTPGPEHLQELFAEMKASSVESCVMEVSSHALEQSRLATTLFEIAIFTNLSQDHLDYHGSMEDYYESKKLLFTQHLKPNGYAIINIDDAYGQRLIEEMNELKINTISFGTSKDADYQINSPTSNLEGSRFTLRHPSTSVLEITIPLIGDFNISNSVASLIALSKYTDKEFTEFNLANFTGIPGRFQKLIEFQKPHVLIDYAHTPDALEKTLMTAKGLCQARLHVIFGCGGDRDQGKRPLMAKAAEEYADFIIVTDDNPRTEDPDQIRSMICEAFDKDTSYVEIEDREDAINYAIRMMSENDTLIIAGKGHEDYQIIGTEKTPFYDYQHALEALKLYWED